MSLADNSTASRCNLLPSTNTTLSLGAADWENIPETVIVNGTIGAILFLSFCLLTYIAWKREEGEYGNQNLISFLYGYRDPDQWYLIPRYEFMRNHERRHHHEFASNKFYVPPRLPLTNPIDIFAYQSEEENLSKPEDDQDVNKIITVKSGKQIPLNTSKLTVTTPTKASVQNPPPASTKSKESISISSLATSPQAAQSASPRNKSLSKSLKRGSVISKENVLSSLSQSFFYPSILTAEQMQASYLSRKLNRFFSVFFRVTDADIIYAKGVDAYEYLLFQRHLILIMVITNVFCLGLILPVHWFIGASIDPTVVVSTSFQQTTIKNMSFTSTLYWVHIISGVCIVVLSVYIMKSYLDSIITREDTQLSRRTLLVGNIPANQRNRTTLSSIIMEHFPGSEIDAIQFVHDTSNLCKLCEKLSVTLVAKDYCQYLKRLSNHEVYVKSTDVNEDAYCYGKCRLCSFLYLCCITWPWEKNRSGIEFYGSQEQQLRIKIMKTFEEMIRYPSEYAFITLRSHKQAKRIIGKLAEMKAEAFGDQQSSGLLSRLARTDSKESNENSNPQTSSTDQESNLASKRIETGSKISLKSDPLDPRNNPHVRSIRSPIKDENIVPASKTVKNKIKNRYNRSIYQLDGPLSWSVRYAPYPDNVEYDDLLHLATTSKFTIISWHAIMIVIFLFFTTPNVVLSIFERLSVLRPDRAKQLTGFERTLINYVSILLQITTTALLPTLITQISRQIPYEDTASKDHSIMWKVYLFLVLMVIIMPSIGMSSAQALFNSDINPICLFPTDNGAYYINYVISSIFLSTILELIKPLDLLSYCFILFTGRSKADYEAGRRYISSEFSIGMNHTSVLLIFSVVMTYAISCPLIAPAGLLYLIVKHVVDHYHLFYSYFTRRVNKDLQNTIIVFVRVALLLMLFQTTIAISINTGTSYFSLISQIVFWITFAVFTLYCFFDCTSNAMRSTKRGRYQHEFCACFYLPRVIEDLLRLDAAPQTCLSRKI